MTRNKRFLTLIPCRHSVSGFLLIALAAITMGSAASALAGQFTWVGNASNDNWTSSANWTGGSRPTGLNDDVLFNNSSNARLATQLANNPVTFGDPNWRLSKITVTNVPGDVTINRAGTIEIQLSGSIGGTGIDMSAAAADLTVEPIVTLTGNQSWTVAGGRLLTKSNGDLQLQSNTLTVTGAGDTTISSLISGTTTGVAITKTGTGTLSLANANNSYSGITTFEGGTINVASLSDYGVNGSLGNRVADAAGPNIGLLFRGGTLQYTGSTAQETDRQIRMAPGNSAFIDASGSNPGATLSFTHTGANLNLFETPGARTLTLTGTNEGANSFSIRLHDQGSNATSLTKSGTGTWHITNTDSTYTGVTTFEGGILNVASIEDYGVASSLGRRTAGQDVSQDIGLLFRGGTLQYTGTTAQTTNRDIRIHTSGGTIDASGSTPTATLSFTGGASADLFQSPGTRTLTLTGTNTGDNLFAIRLTDQGGNATSLTKNGPGTWLLGDGNNSYSGTTTVNGGVLRITADSALGATGTGSQRTNISGGGNTSRVELTAGITTGETFRLNARSGGGANAASLSNLSGTNTITAQVQGATGGNQLNIESQAGTLILAGGIRQVAGGGNRFWKLMGAGDGEISGAIENGTATLNLTKLGAGTWKLNGTAVNTYTGPTTVDAGVLLLAKNNNNQNAIGPGGSIVVNTNGILRLGANSQINDNITAFSINGGTFDAQNFIEGVTPKISLNDGTIEGTSGGFLLARGGYEATGTSTINKRISVRSADANSGLFNIISGTTTAQRAIFTDSGGAQGITKNGAGTLVLQGGENLYAGTTTVNDGVLLLDKADNVDSIGPGGSVVVNSNGTLRLNAHGQIDDNITSISINGGTFDAQNFIEGVTPKISLNDAAITGSSGGYILARGGYEGTGTNSINKRLSLRATDPNSGLFNITGGTTTASQQIFSDGIQGLTKNGAGTLELTAGNTYTGDTNVNAGILAVDGTHSGAGDYFVASGATLGGNGTIQLAPGKSVTVSNSPGAISPGNAGSGYAGLDPTYSEGVDSATVGTLTLDAGDPDALALDMGGHLQIDLLSPKEHDLLKIVDGTVSIGGANDNFLEINGETDFTQLDFTSLGFILFDRVDFLMADEIDGDFDNYVANQFFQDANGHPFMIGNDGSSIFLQAVPEPGSLLIWAAVGFGCAVFGWRRWKAKR